MLRRRFCEGGRNSRIDCREEPHAGFGIERAPEIPHAIVVGPRRQPGVPLLTREPILAIIGLQLLDLEADASVELLNGPSGRNTGQLVGDFEQALAMGLVELSTGPRDHVDVARRDRSALEGTGQRGH